MKKFENVPNDLPGHGKTSPPKKFTMNRGEGAVTTPENPCAKFDITILQ